MKSPSRRLGTLALAAALSLGLSACGGTTTASQPSGSSEPITPPSADPIPKYTPTPAPTPTDAQKKSPRGNILMSVGDTGTSSSKANGNLLYKFTVNSIAPITCNQEYARPSENGALVAVDVTVETTPELAESSYPKFNLSGYDFKYISANGTTFNGNLTTIATYGCIPDAETFPSGGMGPAEKVSAKVLLDLPAPSGILVISHNLSGGFEYNF